MPFGYLAVLQARIAGYWHGRQLRRQQRVDRRCVVRRKDEAAFLPALLAIQEAPVSPTACWTAWIIMALIVTVVIGSVIGQVEIIVNAQGQVIPQSYSKTIAPVETGRVVALLVHNGQHVKAGQLLVQLDPSVIDAERDKLAVTRQVAWIAIARDQALVTAITEHTPPILPSMAVLGQRTGSAIDPVLWQAAQALVRAQYQDYCAKQQQFAHVVGQMARMLPLLTHQVERYRQLARAQDVSWDAWQDKEQARLEVMQHWQAAEDQQRHLTAEVLHTASEHSHDAQMTLATTAQESRRIASLRQWLALTAPVDGIVQQLTVHAVGAVVPAAQPLMHLIPSTEHLAVEAVIRNQDIGFVRSKQAVKVKVHAFDYTKYGTLPGYVDHLSADAVNDSKSPELHYTVHVVLEQQRLRLAGQRVPLVPGMVVSVEIKTGQRRLLDYVLSPLLKTLHEAGHER